MLLFAVTVTAVYLLLRLQFLLFIIFLALLVASGIDRPVGWLERRGAPRVLAILAVYALILGLFGAVGWYVLPAVLGQADTIAQNLPRQLEEVEQLRLRVFELRGEYPIVPELESRLIDLADQAGRTLTRWLLGLPGAVAKAFFTFASVFTIALFLMLTRERLLDLVLSLISPRHRAQTERVLGKMGERLGAYLRAKLIVIIIVGALVWATLFLLGAPYPILVAVFAGITEALPRIGPWIGRAVILMSVAPLGWRAVGIALVAHVVIENLKGQVISPLVESDQVDIHPLTAIIAIISGGILLGWVGVLVAVPVAAAIQVVVEDVIIPWRLAQLASAEVSVVPPPPLLPTPDAPAGERLSPTASPTGDGASRRRPTRREGRVSVALPAEARRRGAVPRARVAGVKIARPRMRSVGRGGASA